MGERRKLNRVDSWRAFVAEHGALVAELPRAALHSEEAFRNYVTSGLFRDRHFTPTVGELSAVAMKDLGYFMQLFHFDMDVYGFDAYWEARRQLNEQR